MSTYNLADTAENSNTFEALPEDRYSLTVETAEVMPTKAGGEMIKITFLVEAGKYKGRKLWHQFPLSEKANIYLVNFLKIVNPGVIKNGVTPQEIASSLAGARVSAWAEPDVTPNGTPTNNLKKFAVVDATSVNVTPPTGTNKPLFA